MVSFLEPHMGVVVEGTEDRLGRLFEDPPACLIGSLFCGYKRKPTAKTAKPSFSGDPTFKETE